MFTTFVRKSAEAKGVVHATERAVRVRMHADDRNIMADGEAQDSAGRVIARNTTDRCEDRRMMRNDKLCTAVDCLLYDSLGCVECAEHTRRLRISGRRTADLHYPSFQQAPEVQSPPENQVHQIQLSFQSLQCSGQLADKRLLTAKLRDICVFAPLHAV